jgi:predicted HTH transcriptional regulator
MEHVRRAVPASGIDSIKDSLVKDTRSKKKVGNKRSGSRRTQRREVILALLKHKSPITVKDVGETIVDCSEKTLQRELVALVQEGVLKKEGERRWSNYFLL